MIIRTLFAFLFVIIFLQNMEAQSLLWEVTGRGFSKPSYLYGTIHIQDERVFAFDSVVYEKLESCDAYAMEILLDEIDPGTMKDMMVMKDKSVKDLISEEDYKFLDSVFKAKTGQSVFFVQKMKPFFLSSQLMQMDMNKEMPDPLDLHFLNKAREMGKKAYGVEKFEDQIAAIDKIPVEEQAEMLMESIRDTSKEKDQFRELLETYVKGDIEKMTELTKDTSMPENFNEEFLVKRNYTMAKNTAKLIKKHPTFIAIGAAHLGGSEGVIALLRKKDYDIEPVKFEFREQDE